MSAAARALLTRATPAKRAPILSPRDAVAVGPSQPAVSSGPLSPTGTRTTIEFGARVNYAHGSDTHTRLGDAVAGRAHAHRHRTGHPVRRGGARVKGAEKT